MAKFDVALIKSEFQPIISFLVEKGVDIEILREMVNKLNLRKRLPSIVTIDDKKYKKDSQLNIYVPIEYFFNGASMIKDIEKMYNKMLNQKKSVKLAQNIVLEKLQKETDSKKQIELLNRFKETNEELQKIEDDYKKQLELFKEKIDFKYYTIDDIVNYL